MTMRFNRKSLLVAALVGTMVAVPALAQQATSSYPPACEASKVTRSDVDRAHTVFLSGKQFLEESNYDKAISYFKDAYSIDCSIHAILPIIATAYERKGDKAEAVRALEEYQRRAPTAPDHDVIDRRIRNLKDQLSHEQAAAATTPPPTATGTPTAGPTSTGAATAEPTATAVASAPTGTSAAEQPSGAGGHSVAPWVLVGVGGAAVVAGVVVYSVGAGDVSAALGPCPTRMCSMSQQDTINQGNNGRSLETVGGVVIGAGVAVAAAGLVWHFLENPGPSHAASVAPLGVGAKPMVAPVVAPGYAGVSFGAEY
jgi:hypothetical protein